MISLALYPFRLGFYSQGKILNLASTIAYNACIVLRLGVGTKLQIDHF